MTARRIAPTKAEHDALADVVGSLRKVQVSDSVTVAAGASTSKRFSVDLSGGYVILAISGFTTSTSTLTVDRWYLQPSGANVDLQLRNMGTSSVTATVTVTLWLVKTLA